MRAASPAVARAPPRAEEPGQGREQRVRRIAFVGQPAARQHAGLAVAAVPESLEAGQLRVDHVPEVHGRVPDLAAQRVRVAVGEHGQVARLQRHGHVAFQADPAAAFQHHVHDREAACVRAQGRRHHQRLWHGHAPGTVEAAVQEQRAFQAQQAQQLGKGVHGGAPAVWAADGALRQPPLGRMVRQAGRLDKRGGAAARHKGRRAADHAASRIRNTEETTMSQDPRELVVLVTRGTDHELSSVAFTIACGGITAGLKVTAFLTSAAVDLVRRNAADMAHVPPLDPLRQLMTDFMARGGTIIACPPCVKASGYTQADFIDGVEVAGASVIHEKFRNGAASLSF